MMGNDIVNKEDNREDNRFVMGGIDYAILRSVAYGIETITDISNILQIRTLTIEKHIYMLAKEGFVNFQLQHFIITSKGHDAIFSFEGDNSENIWMPIEEFIISKMKQQREQKKKMYKMIDIILLVLMIVLIIYIVFIGKDLFI